MAVPREPLPGTLRQRLVEADPTLSGRALEARVDETITEIRQRGGRVAAASRRAQRRRAPRPRPHYSVMVGQLADLLKGADPFAGCDHDWPENLDEDPFCQICGTPHAATPVKEEAA